MLVGLPFRTHLLLFRLCGFRIFNFEFDMAVSVALYALSGAVIFALPQLPWRTGYTEHKTTVLVHGTTKAKEQGSTAELTANNSIRTLRSHPPVLLCFTATILHALQRQ